MLGYTVAMVDGIERPENVNKDPGRFLDDMLAVKIGDTTLRDIIPNPDEAAPILKAAIKRYLNTPLSPDLRDTPYSAALAVAWSIQGEDGDWFSSWLEETGTSTFATLLRRATDQMRNALEKSLVSKLYETQDKKWEVVRLRYRAGIERAGEILDNCLRKTSGGTARRIYEASDMQGEERPEVEIYVVRPTRAETEQASDPKLIFLYFPEDKLLTEIEKLSTRTAEGVEEKNYLEPGDELLGVLLETIRAGKEGEAPGFDVEAIDPKVVQSLTQRPYSGLDEDGVQVPYVGLGNEVDQDIPEILVGNALRPKAKSFTPEQLAEIVANVPIEINMSDASDEQRAAITRVAGSIVDTQPDVSYPNLEYVRCSAMFLSKSAHLPKLAHVGFMMGALYDLDAPNLSHAFELRVNKRGVVNISPDFPQSRIVRRQID